MTNTQDGIVLTLNRLIEVGKNDELSCSSGAREVHDPQLRDILTDTAQSCRASVQELQQLVRSLGGQPRDRGSMNGTLHRGWMEIRHLITPNDDDVVLEMCEREEDIARHEYQTTLQQDLPAEIRAVVQRQYEGIQLHRERIHAMRGMQIH
ncbi:PA2169 family four-helix-bundle protein [Ralstonia pseudosolanacearum]|uniref:PA2169 family four-helix-bundle protein n=1 Tax=Ralstonia pseudosolanacearum TaxID=1310165 RepID=UPI0008DA90F5|nr:PA2169 family four-helix-bundle protein [Ralstonia pseudosolanacearum]MCL1619077.1 PA2169 family four-helix-bundle protein [Ralstonia pseudosolanacearum CaRs-Mep]MCQ4681452.1 PA2169 family four-helix-bundle protein [Ralstonia pseudosolanacearum]